MFKYTFSIASPAPVYPMPAISHISYIDNLPTWSYPWHSHEDYEIVYIMEGNGFMYVNSRPLPCAAGSIALTPVNAMHRLASADASPMPYYSVGLAIPDKTAPGELIQFFEQEGAAVTSSGASFPFIRQTFQQLLHLLSRNNGTADLTVQSLCFALLQLTRELFTESSLTVPAQDDLLASEILNYISEHAYKPLTLESLSKQFYVSSTHLRRVFSNAYHMSPIDYVIHNRITYATEYLWNTNLPISEIAHLVGYENTTHFTNLFVKRIGCTPSEYRTKRLEFSQKISPEA
ncbi:MAG: AraC family transcriptional regulator [Lachnospiraceae bacterium]|nr:AraC family transcriptional regulator [Lachnospiraceae bacterium]